MAFLSKDPDATSRQVFEEAVQLLDDIDKGNFGQEPATAFPPEFSQYGAEEWAKVVANKQLRKTLEEKFTKPVIDKYLQSLGLE